MPPQKDNDPDSQLMARVRRHDEGALRELFRRYYIRLGEFPHSLLRRRDLAQEAVSNVFVNVWQRREKLEITTSVQSYLFTAVGNQARNIRKGESKYAAISLDQVPASELVDVPGVDSDVLYREYIKEINAALMRLPPQRELVFRLSRLEGLRYREIARTLGLSPHTVQNHMIHAKRQLAREVPTPARWPEQNSSRAPVT